jgi:hypothetical protein
MLAARSFALSEASQIESVLASERRQNSSETDRKCTEESDKLPTDVMAACELTFPLSRGR